MTAQKLSVRQKISYGFGEISQTTGFTVVSFFFLFFLTDAVGIDPRMAGYVLLIGKVWDAITDPAMGILSDRTKSKFGRRRLYMFWGSIPYAITFIFLWVKPAFLSPGTEFLYYALMFVLYSTFLTIAIVPYNALSAELTQDYQERTSLFSYRMAFSILFGLVAAALPPLVRNTQPDRMTGYFVMGIVFSALVGLPMIFTVWNTKEKFQASPKRASSPKTFIKTLWQNRVFRIAAIVFLLSWMTLDVVAAAMEYFVTYVAQLKPLLPAILAVLFISSALCLPIIVWLSNKFGKPKTYIMTMLYWSVVLSSLYFVPAHSATPIFIIAVLSGLGVAAIHVIPMALAADVVEVDEQVTGERREGIYFGIVTFTRKVATGLGLFLLGNALAISGYVANAQQPESAITAIRLVLSFGPAIILFAATWVASRYPLTEAEHAAIVEELEAKREGSLYA